jgi:signal transduction histidine kinase
MEHGTWTATRPLTRAHGGRTMILTWDEAYNIISGSMHRATYVNVPPGKYVFRAIGITAAGEPAAADLTLDIVIPPPLWQEPWFYSLVAGGTVFLLAAAILIVLRRRAKRRIERLRLLNAIESDRTRIARDMHDDLGTRVTVLTMAASLVERDIERDPPKARAHLAKMSASARELVSAMDSLVWAVDPSNDTLDHLGAHLSKTSQEFFRDTPVKFRTRIPAQLPAIPLHSDFRHHLSLAVKEALNNVLRHAGPCEASLELTLQHGVLTLRIEDSGCGFQESSVSRGHGLGNLRARMADLGGTCEISPTEGGGTRVMLSCPIPKNPMSMR